jgi:protocatechuate 3,4-dioxygenase beta subunit
VTSEDRLALLVGRTVEALRELIEELDVTIEEWHAALDFFTEVGKRDEFILLSDVNGLSVFVDEVTHRLEAVGTPSNVLGPFWLPDAPLMDTPARMCRSEEPGDPLILTGTVRGVTGEPVADAVLDVWQTAANRLYENQDPEQPDMNLRGRVRVAPDGSFEVHTVRPVPYEIPTDGPVGRFLEVSGRHAWRPAHIHLRVEASSYRPLTTMVYVAGDPWLDDDAIGSVKDALVIKLETGTDGVLHASFDVTLVPP